jgi:hypothetical protein
LSTLDADIVFGIWRPEYVWGVLKTESDNVSEMRGNLVSVGFWALEPQVTYGKPKERDV